MNNQRTTPARELFSVVRGIWKFTGWIKFPKHPSSHSPSSACVLSCFSHVRLFVTLWTVPRQAPLAMGFSRQEYWSGLPCPPENLPNPGIKSTSLTSPAQAGKFFVTGTTWEAPPPIHTLYLFSSHHGPCLTKPVRVTWQNELQVSCPEGLEEFRF